LRVAEDPAVRAIGIQLHEVKENRKRNMSEKRKQTQERKRLAFQKAGESWKLWKKDDCIAYLKSKCLACDGTVAVLKDRISTFLQQNPQEKNAFTVGITDQDSDSGAEDIQIGDADDASDSDAATVDIQIGDAEVASGSDAAAAAVDMQIGDAEVASDAAAVDIQIGDADAFKSTEKICADIDEEASEVTQSLLAQSRAHKSRVSPQRVDIKRYRQSIVVGNSPPTRIVKANNILCTCGCFTVVSSSVVCGCQMRQLSPKCNLEWRCCQWCASLKSCKANNAWSKIPFYLFCVITNSKLG